MNNNPLEKLKQHISLTKVESNISLAQFTTFKIGGPAKYFVKVKSIDALVEAIIVARKLDIPWFLLGMGANILISDNGFNGLVIQNCADDLSVDLKKSQIKVASGYRIFPDLIDVAKENQLSGIEHYAGIPSTVGGAMWQNLHFLSPAPKRERTMFIAEVVASASILTAGGEIKTVNCDYFKFGYDDSILHHQADIVLSVTFQLEKKTTAAIQRVVDENLQWRGERHPPLDTEPSAGSIFKKIEGIGAGRLIDGCGMKGKMIGGAMISPRHANILINAGGATASDVRQLIALIQKTVKAETGYFLEPEVGMIGF